MQTMSCQQLMPTHNSSNNRLQPGLLQQAPHSCLVVDECISTLTSTSNEHDAWYSRNMHSMHEYLKTGMLTANYMWQQVRLPASGSVLVVSDEPSRFSESCRICVSATSAPEKTTASVDPATHPLQCIRAYLACAWDLWEGLEYERSEAGHTGSHPRWVAETLVAKGKHVAAAVNSAGAANCDSTSAYETAVMLLHCLCISQGKNIISRSDWSAVDRVVASCQARCGSAAVLPSAGLELKEQEQVVASVPLQQLHASPSTDEDMDSGEQVLRARQAPQGVSAGQAMIDALRRTGAL
jgi:hypothetical protein